MSLKYTVLINDLEDYSNYLASNGLFDDHMEAYKHMEKLAEEYWQETEQFEDGMTFEDGCEDPDNVDIQDRFITIDRSKTIAIVNIVIND